MAKTPAKPEKAPKPGKAAKSKQERGGLPSKDQLLDYIRSADGKVGKREIARAFRVQGSDRIYLKRALRELEADGEIERAGPRQFATPSELPSVFPAEIVEIDDDLAFAKPLAWSEDAPPPRIEVHMRARSPAVGLGDRVLLRVLDRHETWLRTSVLRRIGRDSPGTVVGVVEETRTGLVVRPTERNARTEYSVAPGNAGNAHPGELVAAKLVGNRHLGLPGVKIVKRLGGAEGAQALSLIAIHAHNLAHEFSAEAIAQADAAKPVPLGDRVDFRQVPLVTIDGSDARDFDDAVFAEKTDDGWRLLVAIADVAHYVRPGDPIDREAAVRGNSVYLPDRVVPMLPEALSNTLCSLQPGQDRACVVAEIMLDRGGQQTEHTFHRGLMRSVARLTYEQVQAAIDGNADGMTAPLMDDVIAPLHGAYKALLKARKGRGTLEIHTSEAQVILDANRQPVDVVERPSLPSHQLIEEFMIAANVAAARTLGGANVHCLYRVHDEPNREAVEDLRGTLAALGLKLPRGARPTGDMFNKVLTHLQDRPERELINVMVLRAQATAVYSPDNIGHFGLGLDRYTHFTSPIRRYADLTVHRGLIAQCRLGEGGWEHEPGLDTLRELGGRLSSCERRATVAERETVSRFAAQVMLTLVGKTLPGTVSGVTRAGAFIRIDRPMAEGFMPISMVADERIDFDRDRNVLSGRRSGTQVKIGDRVDVHVREADPLTGGLILEPERWHQTHRPTTARGGRARPAQKGGRSKKTSSRGTSRRRRQ